MPASSASSRATSAASRAGSDGDGALASNRGARSRACGRGAGRVVVLSFVRLACLLIFRFRHGQLSSRPNRTGDIRRSRFRQSMRRLSRGQADCATLAPIDRRLAMLTDRRVLLIVVATLVFAQGTALGQIAPPRSLEELKAETQARADRNGYPLTGI